jgi:ferredoxin/flavodoxin
MDIKIFIVFSSPAGSTRRVAEVIGAGFSRRNFETRMLDLGTVHDHSEILVRIRKAGRQGCLFVGSPVYRDGAVPPVVGFIESLPEIDGALAVPYVTWGQACSGLALWQMGDGLVKKGFKIAAAAKVLAAHSMMWRATTPAGKGHPDRTDLGSVEDLVNTLCNRFESGDIPNLVLDTLDYQPRERAQQIKKKMDKPWMIVPKKVNTETCTQCGICVEECPAAAVNLNPYPQFDPNCFDCFNCIRLCPEDAIEPAISMSQIEAQIRERVRTISERPFTQIWL